MPNESTKTHAQSAVADLNAKAERLGWARRFELLPGSNTNGVRHSMDVNVPELAHPVTNIDLGPTYREALLRLEAMNTMLNQALAERSRDRHTILSGGGDLIRTVEPEEESFPFHPALTKAEQDDFTTRPAGADQ